MTGCSSYTPLQKHRDMSIAGLQGEESPARPMTINSRTQRLVGRQDPVAALGAAPGFRGHYACAVDSR